MKHVVETLIEDLIEREGGEKFTDHPSDRGGPTRWGVTEAVARAFGYEGDMRTMPKSIAVEIYLERYWLQPGFSQIEPLSAMLAQELFDTGVNMGTAVAAGFLQRALNTLNAQGRHFPDIAADGVIGRITLHALKEFLKRRGNDGEIVLFRMLNAQQSVRYMELAERRKSQEDFQFGWQLHRVQGSPA